MLLFIVPPYSVAAVISPKSKLDKATTTRDVMVCFRHALKKANMIEQLSVAIYTASVKVKRRSTIAVLHPFTASRMMRDSL
jgi:hypothetical protein